MKNAYPYLRLAAVSLPWRAERSLADLRDFLARQPLQGLDLLVLPMRCLNADPPQESVAGLKKISASLKLHLVANLDQAPGQNISFLFGPDGREIGRYLKSHALPYEAILPGNHLPVFKTALGRIGMISGTDHYFPEIMEVMALQGAEIIAWSQAPELVRDSRLAETKMRARAIDDNVFLICADYASQTRYMPSNLDGHRYGEPTGRSYIINPLGDFAAATAYEPGMALASVRPRHPRNVWHNIRGITGELKPQVYGLLTRLTGVAELPAVGRKIKLAFASVKREHGRSAAGEPIGSVLNTDFFFPLAAQAAASGADLVALGEFLGMNKTAERFLAGLARRHCCYISAAGWGRQKPAYGLLFGRDGKIAGRYDVVTDGAGQVPVFDTDIGRIGMKICRDIRQQELDRIYGLKGADIVLWPSMAWGPSGALLALKNRGRAIDNGFYVVTSTDPTSDPGQRSMVIDPYGEVLYASPFMQEEVGVFEFTPAKQGWFNPQNMTAGYVADWPQHRRGLPAEVPVFERNFREVWRRCRRPGLYSAICRRRRSDSLRIS